MVILYRCVGLASIYINSSEITGLNFKNMQFVFGRVILPKEGFTRALL